MSRHLSRLSVNPRLDIVIISVAMALSGFVVGCGDSPYSVKSGSVVIVQEPAGVDAPWRLVGEHGFTNEGHGDGIVHGLRSGRYTVVWIDAWGWNAPPPQIVTVTTAEEPTVTGLYRASSTVFPGTPTALMTNFVLAYSNGDLDLYLNLLDPEHVTILQQVTIEQHPELGSRLDLAEERRIHQRMFSGQDLVDPDGAPVPAVSDIWINSLMRQGDWELSPPTDPIPGVMSATYSLRLTWSRNWPHEAQSTQGNVKFYVTSQDTIMAGVKVPRYRLRAQLDQTTEDSWSLCWGSVKAQFR